MARKAAPFSAPEADTTPNGAKTASSPILRDLQQRFSGQKPAESRENTIFSGEQFLACAWDGGEEQIAAES